MNDDTKTDSPDGPEESVSPGAIVQAKTLFGESREIVIEHDGERYKLRITRRGKLILQK